MLLPLACLLLLLSCTRSTPTIAVIPRTCATTLWEAEHAGVAAVAQTNGMGIYWNAPTQEDDVQTQIAFLETAVQRRYKGIIVAPDETLPFRTPIRKVLNRNIPVVIVDTDLGLPPGPRISYVMNDEQAGGELAAHRVATLLHGHGSVAVIGVNPHLSSITARERSFEQAIAREFPGIHVSVRREGNASVPHEQEIAEEMLHSGQPIDAIVAVSSFAMDGAYYALVEANMVRRIPLIGFDQDMLALIRTGEIDSVIAQNTYRIGRLAMAQMQAEIDGKSTRGKLLVPPVLLTSSNLGSSDAREILSYYNYPWRKQ